MLSLLGWAPCFHFQALTKYPVGARRSRANSRPPRAQQCVVPSTLESSTKVAVARPPATS